MEFTITDSKESVFTITADNYNEAALKAARRLFGYRTTISTIRTTGNSLMSGYFQAYLPVPTGGRTSHGSAFHVREN